MLVFNEICTPDNTSRNSKSFFMKEKVNFIVASVMKI